MSILSALVDVFTPEAALFAVVSGVIFGLAVGWVSINPLYSAGTAPAGRVGVLAALFAASGGLTFFAFQTLATLIHGDPLWPRVMSRYGEWVVFSLAIGATAWVLVRRDRSRRRRAAHDRASNA